MKKFLLLFISITVLYSCSSDDDSTPQDDNILGTWYVAEVNNFPGDFTLTECNRESFIIFNADNTTTSEFHSQPEEECTSQGSDEGEWENLGNSRYRFNIPFESIGAQPGRVEFNEDNSQFTFHPALLEAQNTTIVFEKR